VFFNNSKWEKQLLVGDRVARGKAPENTLAAINSGIEVGADRIEIDVRLITDKKVVVIHDCSLRRINGSIQRINC
jgi:glycerophosphoryl diester phosphodiesterase